MPHAFTTYALKSGLGHWQNICWLRLRRHTSRLVSLGGSTVWKILNTLMTREKDIRLSKLPICDEKAVIIAIEPRNYFAETGPLWNKPTARWASLRASRSAR